MTAAPAPVVEYIALFLPAPVLVHIARAPAVIAARAPVVERIAPTSAVSQHVRQKWGCSTISAAIAAPAPGGVHRTVSCSDRSTCARVEHIS